MLNNIVFTDDIFLLSRVLGVISQGIRLDISEEVFTKKFEMDIVFSSDAIKKIYNRLADQSQLPDYIPTMKCLYSCSTRFLEILADLENDRREIFLNLKQKIPALKKEHEQIKLNIAQKIHNTNTDAEIINIVSETELTELLNFQDTAVMAN